MPTARADIGTSEWLVMPGEVFTSIRNGLLSAARSSTSTRPQPSQSSARYASTARRDISAAVASSSAAGQKYLTSSVKYLFW